MLDKYHCTFYDVKEQKLKVEDINGTTMVDAINNLQKQYAFHVIITDAHLINWETKIKNLTK